MNAIVPGPSERADWIAAPVNDLVDHIIRRYHERHRVQLPELIRLARKVEHVHEAHRACPAGLADVLDGLMQALESHMLKEEQVLFPMFVQGMGTMARGPVAVMRFEHEEQEAALNDIRRVTQNLTLPGDACNTWRALHGGLKIFMEDLAQHIRLENDVLFVNASNAAEGAQHGRV